MKSHDKSFLIALLSWIVLSLFFTFAGIHFITSVGVANVISIAAFVFFEYVYYDNEKKTEC
ncbi:hypothetical protein [Staphylococcus warneri]|uniref:hypothetical protein n=1 Tax=Staphylococcus warneri TaxID=1292 RepID=UPI0031CDB9B3